MRGAEHRKYSLEQAILQKHSMQLANYHAGSVPDYNKSADVGLFHGMKAGSIGHIRSL